MPQWKFVKSGVQRGDVIEGAHCYGNLISALNHAEENETFIARAEHIGGPGRSPGSVVILSDPIEASHALNDFAIWCAERALSVVSAPDASMLMNAISKKRAWLAGEVSPDELAIIAETIGNTQFVNDGPEPEIPAWALAPNTVHENSRNAFLKAWQATESEENAQTLRAKVRAACDAARRASWRTFITRDGEGVPRDGSGSTWSTAMFASATLWDRAWANVRKKEGKIVSTLTSKDPKALARKRNEAHFAWDITWEIAREIAGPLMIAEEKAIMRDTLFREVRFTAEYLCFQSATEAASYTARHSAIVMAMTGALGHALLSDVLEWESAMRLYKERYNRALKAENNVQSTTLANMLGSVIDL